MSDPKIVNLSDLPWTPWITREGVAAEVRDPARKLGSSHCGLRVYRLAPGMQATRLHRQLLQEEMFLILAGSGTLRHDDRSVPVKAGNRLAYEVCEYPEEGTVYVEAIDKTLRNEEVTGERAAREAWFKAGR